MKNNETLKLTTIVGCAALLVGCGSGSSSIAVNEVEAAENEPGTSDVVLTGIFLDSPVEGVSYTTATQSGITTSSGGFSYLTGESVQFFIGDLKFPVVGASATVSPLTMAAIYDNAENVAINIGRLLQSIDQDANPDNGIFVPAGAAENSAPIDFNLDVDFFANQSSIINFVANSGSENVELISIDQAIEHLNTSLGSNLGYQEVSESITPVDVYSRVLDFEVSRDSVLIGRENLTATISSTNNGQLFEVIRNGEELLRVSAGTCIVHSVDEVTETIEGLVLEISDFRPWGYFEHRYEVVDGDSLSYSDAGHLPDDEYEFITRNENTLVGSGTYQICYDTTVDLSYIRFFVFDPDQIRYAAAF